MIVCFSVASDGPEFGAESAPEAARRSKQEN